MTNPEQANHLLEKAMNGAPLPQDAEKYAPKYASDATSNLSHSDPSIIFHEIHTIHRRITLKHH